MPSAERDFEQSRSDALASINRVARARKNAFLFVYLPLLLAALIGLVIFR
jgi:hypothetical protein